MNVMTTLKTHYDNSLTLEQYLAHMQVNKDEMLAIYDAFQVPDDARLQEIKDKDLKAIVITEDWCGDAMVNIPVLMRIAEAASIDLRFSLRDDNLELMDQYLTNGTARSIPIFVFLDATDHQYAVWGPRAQVVQDYVTEVRQNLPSKDAPDFEEQQKAVHHTIHEKYKNTPEFWEEIYNSIVERLIHL